MSLKLSFSWLGLVIFTLPMLINIAYAVFPPNGEVEQAAAISRWIEMIEQVSRMAYLLTITLLVSREPLSFRSVSLPCRAFPAFVLHRMDPLFCGRTGHHASEPAVSFGADAAGSVPCSVFSVRCRLAA